MHGSLTSLEHGSQFFFRSHRHCLINITKVSQINTHDHTVVLGLTPPPHLSPFTAQNRGPAQSARHGN
ncbi:LytTR family transcriptional regulator DNA-binding domain-containing protein [Limosilactobacillus oris]|uniref:LytTR family transcriptional regulator DNA-binding domain-containing protein n=1 Tax=Limosilactobacillus oris TaxID=1632 RepID=UPI001F3353B2|nr:LytTR family transcriptional regulator DNA-binding domain-containing protein [Limosilactobacillus oris]